MQNFVFLATFFLVEKKGPQKRERRRREKEDEKCQVLWPLRCAGARTPLGPKSDRCNKELDLQRILGRLEKPLLPTPTIN